MIAHWEIIQGTDEWHQIRYRKIGGTRSKQLLDGSDALMVELVGESVEEFEVDHDSYESADMQRGYELEPIARERINDKFNIELLPCGWLQDELLPILGYSPDGITQDFETMCEIKCPAMKKHTATILSGRIPLDNINQCIHAFAVNPHLKRLIFASFRPESIQQLFTYVLTRESEVNIGTESKPKLFKVSDVVEKINEQAKLFTHNLRIKIDSLTF